MTTKNKEQELFNPAPKKPSDSWSFAAISFNLIGILVSLPLIFFGGTRAFKMVDSFWLSYVGDTKAYVIDLRKRVTEDGKNQNGVVLLIDKKGKYSEAKVLIFDEKLYAYVKNRYHPPRQLRVSVYRVQRVMSGQAGVARVGPLRLFKPPKSSSLIIFFGLFAMGLGIVFASLRDLRKRWLRRGLLA